jgi:hypothetical protein
MPPLAERAAAKAAKAATKAAAKAAATAVKREGDAAAAAAPATAPEVGPGLNGDLLAHMHSILTDISEHPAFDGVRTQLPSHIGDGMGRQDTLVSNLLYHASIMVWGFHLCLAPGGTYFITAGSRSPSIP